MAWKDLNCSVPNPRLYNEAFAKIMQRCQHCLSEDHGSTGCPQHPNPMLVGWFHPPDSLPQIAGLGGAVPTPPSTSNRALGADLCRNFQCRPLPLQPLPICSFLPRLCRPPFCPELLTSAGSTSVAGASAQPSFAAAATPSPTRLLRHPLTRGPRQRRPASQSANRLPPLQSGMHSVDSVYGGNYSV